MKSIHLRKLLAVMEVKGKTLLDRFCTFDAIYV